MRGGWAVTSHLQHLWCRWDISGKVAAQWLSTFHSPAVVKDELVSDMWILFLVPQSHTWEMFATFPYCCLQCMKVDWRLTAVGVGWGGVYMHSLTCFLGFTTRSWCRRMNFMNSPRVPLHVHQRADEWQYVSWVLFLAALSYSFRANTVPHKISSGQEEKCATLWIITLESVAAFSLPFTDASSATTIKFTNDKRHLFWQSPMLACVVLLEVARCCEASVLSYGECWHHEDVEEARHRGGSRGSPLSSIFNLDPYVWLVKQCQRGPAMEGTHFFVCVDVYVMYAGSCTVCDCFWFSADCMVRPLWYFSVF